MAHIDSKIIWYHQKSMSLSSNSYICMATLGFAIVQACVNLIWQTEITQDPTKSNVYKPNAV